ncbi:MAG TPA: EF-hand domain-containing protein [Polyangiaceae bacterium]|jgi:calmodulin
MTELSETRREALRRQFQQFDHDQNGVIEREEFYALLDELGAQLSAVEIERAFATIDKDKSGGIEFEEFCSWWRFQPHRA